MKNLFKGIVSKASVEGDKNIVVQNLSANFGVSFTEAKQIALEVFNENFYRVSAEARSIAAGRIESFTDALLSEIMKVNPDGIDSFTDPGMQYSLFHAQSNVARSGDRDVAALLIDLIIKRTMAKERNYDQIIVDEAIDVVGKITSTQMVILSLLYVTKALLRGFSSMEQLEAFFQMFISKVLKDFTLSLEMVYNNLTHLNYAGCISSGSIGSDFSITVHNNYDLGFNHLGHYTFYQLIEKFSSKAITLEHVNEDVKQKTFISLYEFETVCADLRINQQLINDMSKAIRKHIYDMKELAERIDREPYKSLSLLHKKYALSDYRLTSVGIPIAKSYIKQATGVAMY